MDREPPRKFATTPGTRDVLSPESTWLRDVQGLIRDRFRLFGFREILTPALEYSEVIEEYGLRDASTLYNAVNDAGLDVTERYPHYAQLPYVRPGLDATVWFSGPGEADDLDMKFENTSDGYVLLKEYVAWDGFIYAEVWGRPSGADVKTWSEPVYRNAKSAEWVTYQTYKKNGKIVFDGVLHKHTYEALKDEKDKPIPADTVPIAPVDP